MDMALSTPSGMYTFLFIKHSFRVFPQMQVPSRNEAAGLWSCCIDSHLLCHQSTRCFAATRSFSHPFCSRKYLIWSLSTGGRNAADLLHTTVTKSRSGSPCQSFPSFIFMSFRNITYSICPLYTLAEEKIER